MERQGFHPCSELAVHANGHTLSCDTHGTYLSVNAGTRWGELCGELWGGSDVQMTAGNFWWLREYLVGSCHLSSQSRWLQCIEASARTPKI